MMTAEFMLSKRPVLRFTAALFFLLPHFVLFPCTYTPSVRTINLGFYLRHLSNQNTETAK